MGCQLDKLIFGKGNAKLDREVLTFSLPSGYTCPGAQDCLSRANKKTGKITDGPETQFRCFSASQEALLPIVRKARWKNHDLLKSAAKKGGKHIVDLIGNSLPSNPAKVRIHVAGDFFSQLYFDSWIKVATQFPHTLFYGYTKSLPYWISRLPLIPANFVLTASVGGKFDTWIDEYNLKNARVVYSVQEAADLGLPIDHDDSCAMNVKPKAFALLLHGTQPAGSAAVQALTLLKRDGEYGYGKKAEARRSV